MLLESYEETEFIGLKVTNGGTFYRDCTDLGEQREDSKPPLSELQQSQVHKDWQPSLGPKDFRETV